MQRILYRFELQNKSQFAEAEVKNPAYNFDHSVMEYCPVCGRCVTDGKWMHPKIIRLTKKAQPDILPGYGIDGRFLVSENFMQKYLSSGLKGIIGFDKVDSVRPCRKTCTVDTDYYSVDIVRSMITINLDKSVISFGTAGDGIACPQCKPAGQTMNFIKKLAFNMDNDEGYDVFEIYGTGGEIFFSEEFVRFCEEAKITNLSYVRLDEADPWLDVLFDDDDLARIFE